MHCIGIRRFAAVIAAVLVSAGVAGCGGGDVTISAAASLREVVPRIVPSARVNIGGSDVLATQIAEGAPVDVFVSASPEQTDRLAARGLVRQPVAIATNRLVVVVPAANPAGVTTLDDLGTPGLRLVIGQRSVPVGDYARSALGALGLTDALRNVVSNESSVAGVLAKVRLGEADAGIVYATDARAAGDAVRTIDIPARAQPRIVISAAVVAAAPDRARARTALAALRDARGRRILAEAGFGPPPGG